MADILIKNTKMPKYCYESDGQVVKPCDFLEVCRREWGVNINALDIHSEACPIVALPPHGRLCDLDSLIEHETYNIEQALFDSDEVLEDLKNAPVIVEANYGTDN